MAALTATMSKHCWALNDVLANCMGNSGYEALSVRLAAGMFSVTLAVAMSVMAGASAPIGLEVLGGMPWGVGQKFSQLQDPPPPSFPGELLKKCE